MAEESAGGSATITVVLVAKCPMLGRCKTRLAKTIGPDLALDVARSLLQDIALKTLEEARVPGHKIDYVVFYGPASSAEDIEKLRIPPPWRKVAISDEIFHCGDLGAILKSGLDLGPHGVTVFLGMDCPYLSAEDYRQAALEATCGGAFLCPADDGGYVLLALPPRAPHALFDNVEWSCARTLESQVTSLRSAGLQVVTGRTQGDIDDVADLRTLVTHLKHLRAQRGGNRKNERGEGGEGKGKEHLEGQTGEDGRGEGGGGLPSMEGMLDRLEATLAALPLPPT